MKKKKALKVITEIAAEETDKSAVFSLKDSFFNKAVFQYPFLDISLNKKYYFFK